MPDSAERNQRELLLQIAFAGVLVMTKGYSAPEVARATSRMRELAAQDGDPAQLLLVLADELVQLATDHEFAQYLAHGLTMRGCALAEQGHFHEGIAQLRQSIEMLRAMQHGIALGHALSLLAEPQAGSGGINDARPAVEEGLAALSEEDIYRPTLLRLRGELLAREGSPEAEASFREAIELAQRQESKMYELRASTSLARWLSERGRVAEARRLLAPLYASFTEGFDTRDLVEAKALLEELA